jgi:hypothetical protein
METGDGVRPDGDLLQFRWEAAAQHLLQVSPNLQLQIQVSASIRIDVLAENIFAPLPTQILKMIVNPSCYK